MPGSVSLKLSIKLTSKALTTEGGSGGENTTTSKGSAWGGAQILEKSTDKSRKLNFRTTTKSKGTKQKK